MMTRLPIHRVNAGHESESNKPTSIAIWRMPAIMKDPAARDIPITILRRGLKSCQAKTDPTMQFTSISTKHWCTTIKLDVIDANICIEDNWILSIIFDPFALYAMPCPETSIFWAQRAQRLSAWGQSVVDWLVFYGMSILERSICAIWPGRRIGSGGWG